MAFVRALHPLRCLPRTSQSCTYSQSVVGLHGHALRYCSTNPVIEERRKRVVRPGTVTASRTVPDNISKPSYLGKLWGIKQWFMSKGPEIKTERQIQGMRDACSLAQHILTGAGKFATVGTTTDEIDWFVHEECLKNGAYPSPLLYRTFPKSVCTSVNNVICHGIPDDRPLQDGDIINIDVTVYLNGFHGDCSKTFLVGDVDVDAQQLCYVAQHCRDAAIALCGPGQAFKAIGNTIDILANDAGYQVIPDLIGHGIGSEFHAPPDVLHHKNNRPGFMFAGMTFTIEPVITEGDTKFVILDDGWTIVSADSSWSAQYEHTILITDHGAEVLTQNAAQTLT